MEKNTKKSILRRFVGTTEFGVLIALIILMAFVSIMSPYFLTVRNIFNILQQMSLIVILGVGTSLVILSGGIDLSISYILGLCGCLMVKMVYAGVPWGIIFFLIILIGAGLGLANGLIVAKTGIPPFIVTLGTGYILKGCMLLVTGGQDLSYKSPISFLGGGFIGRLPFSVIIMFICVIIGWFFTKYTHTGRNIYALGNNKRAASLSGINSSRLTCLIFAIQGAFCGLAGIVAAGKLNACNAGLGAGKEMDAIVAVVVGGFSMAGGEGNTLGILLGAAIAMVVSNALVMLGVNSYWQTIMTGVVLLLAVSIDPVKKMLAERRYKVKD